MKGKKLLVDKYNHWVDKMSTNLDCLDQQVAKLTAGDLRIAKKREGKIKFNSNRDPNKLAVYGNHDNDNESADEEE